MAIHFMCEGDCGDLPTVGFPRYNFVAALKKPNVSIEWLIPCRVCGLSVGWLTLRPMDPIAKVIYEDLPILPTAIHAECREKETV